ncbi:MFS transporter [Streptomyces sp. SS162]|uniref:MFS transporter n=1 Tax=Streptomyces sp. SS162 TaxID=3108484 RepID=UPI003FCED853
MTSTRPPAGLPGGPAGDEPAEPAQAAGQPVRPDPPTHPRWSGGPYGVVVLATGLAALLHLGWYLFAANSGGDLAAQDAWAAFAARHPGSAYNLGWYGGMHTMSYSVLSPYVMALLGVRTTMAVAGTLSAALTALLLVRVPAVRNPLACSLAAVAALLGNALSGRATFGLGLLFALGAAAVVLLGPWLRPRGARANRWVRGAAAALLAGAATAASPVAGLFLGVLAAALLLRGRRTAAYALGVPAAAVVAATALLFPFAGTQPLALGTVLLPLLFAALCLLAAPRAWRTVRTAAAVYAAGAVLTWLVDSQVGSNVTRLPMLFAGVVLLAALPYACSRRARLGLLAALVVFHGWVGFKSVDDVRVTAPHAAWADEAVRPLLDELERRGAARSRVEVVPARSHRESSALAPYVTLARGWNRQADLERNPGLYDGSLTAAGYRAWLDRWAVRYVVLPAGAPDTGAREEAALVAGGLPYLEQVWADRHWRLFAVRGAAPLAGPGATVERAAADGVTLRVERPGTVLVKVAYSPWLSLVDGDGERLAPAAGSGRAPCLRAAPRTAVGDVWTELHAPAPGTYRLGSPYTAFPRGTPCP